MRKTILIPILLGAIGSLNALAPSHLVSSLNDPGLPGNILSVPKASKASTGSKRSASGPALTILTPFAAGQVGGAFFPMERAFDGQPSWDATSGSPNGGTGGANAPSFDDRYGYIDFGTGYADLRITATWTQYIAWSNGDQTPYAEMWWDDDTDSINDNGTVETRLNFNSAQGLSGTATEQWVEDSNHELSPITPASRYLICRSATSMTSHAKEYAFVGYIESPPEAPSLLEVLHVDENSVRLGWQDGSNNEVGFSIERSTSLTSGYTVIGTTERDIAQYEDNGLPSSTTYYYRVQALNAAGASPYTNPLEVSTTQNVTANTDLTHDPRHNGSITAIKWKYFGDDEEKLYTYHYDEANQLEAAQYATGLTSHATDHWTTGQAGGFSVPGISYDQNGNITSLNRQADEEGVRTIDALSYAYVGGNQLVAVSDLTGWDGFADKNNAGNDYAYDDNGNLIKDENQGIDSIVYNHMDLPERIFKNTGEYILYSYDAAGVKLSEELYNAQDERVKRTDYFGEFIFENGELKQVHHEEGRIVPDATAGGFEYQYFLRDHLGNNRVVVSATPKTHTFTLNYEGEVDDQPLFQQVTIRENDIFDHTDMLDTTYTHAQFLDAHEGSRVGSVIALPVHAGDTLSASVFAKYVEITPNASNVITSLAANLISAFTGSSGTTNELGNSTINTNFGDGALIGTTGFPLEDVNAPMAFLNVMFLPNEEVIDLEKDVTFAYDQLNAAATQRLDEPKNTNFDELRVDNFIAPGQGYFLVYLSNESTTFTEVYFDDLSIALRQHNVTQKDDYYPFGLSFNSYKRPEYQGDPPNTPEEVVIDIDIEVEVIPAHTMDDGNWRLSEDIQPRRQDAGPNIILFDGMYTLDGTGTDPSLYRDNIPTRAGKAYKLSYKVGYALAVTFRPIPVNVNVSLMKGTQVVHTEVVTPSQFNDLREIGFTGDGSQYHLKMTIEPPAGFTQMITAFQVSDFSMVELLQDTVTISFAGPNEYLYQGKELLEGTDWYDFHARNYHAALGRFMSVDPVYNGPSGYVGMLNNPVATIDPDGKDPSGGILTAVAIAAAIRGVSYTASIALSDGGFNNWDWGQFGQQVAIGAASAPITFGIGETFNVAAEVAKTATKQAMIEVGRMATHATFQGGLSVAQGGDFWTAFGSGVVGGAVGLGTNGWESNFTRNATTIGSAMLLGGATAELTGGEFWKGAATSGIVAGANHVAHRLGDNLLEKTKQDQGGDPPCPNCPQQNGGNDPKDGDGTYNALLERAKNGGSYAGYVSGVIGAGQLSFRMPAMGPAVTAYGKLGAARVGLGRLGTAGSLASVPLDYYSMRSGEITSGRFAYRFTGVGASIGTGAYVGGQFGGPWGAVAGSIVSGVFWLGEQVYDMWNNTVMPAMRSTMPTGNWSGFTGFR